MNKRIILTLLTFITFSMHAKLVVYHYDLNFEFLKNGATSLINKAKESSEETYKKSLEDIVHCARINDIDAEKALTSIQDTLTKKINYIERIKDKSVDWQQIGIGTGYIAASAAAGYGIYYGYNNYYKPNNDAYHQQAAGFVTVHPNYSTHALELTPHPNTNPTQADADQLLTLWHKDEFIGTMGITTAFWGIAAAMAGAKKIMTGLYPDHSDDENLEKYERLLAITKKVREQHLKITS